MARTCPNCGAVVSSAGYTGYMKFGALYCDVDCCREAVDSLPDPQ